MLNRRDRLVSFRVSEEEYEHLRSLSMAQKSRSISDFARTALRNVLVMPPRNDDFAKVSKSMEMTISHLTQSTGELSRVISQVLRRIERDSNLQESRENSNSVP